MTILIIVNPDSAADADTTATAAVVELTPRFSHAETSFISIIVLRASTVRVEQAYCSTTPRSFCMITSQELHPLIFRARRTP